MFWSAQAVKGDVNFVGLLAPSLQINCGCFEATIGGGFISAPQRRFKYKKLGSSRECRSAVATSDQKDLILIT